MKDLTNLPGRMQHPLFGWGDARNGVAVIKHAPSDTTLRVIFSDGEGWDHVSVSTAQRCPTWEEMSYIKELFFDPEEVAVQFHPARSNYVNCHPFCLHLWRHQTQPVLMPPLRMVA